MLKLPHCDNKIRSIEMPQPPKECPLSAEKIVHKPSDPKTIRVNSSQTISPPALHIVSKGLSDISSTKLPDNFSWYKKDNNIIEDGRRNQGSLGCCWSMASASVLGDRIAIKYKKESPYPSSAFLMLCGNGDYTPSDQNCGGNNYIAVQFMQNNGLKLESCFPYSDFVNFSNNTTVKYIKGDGSCKYLPDNCCSRCCSNKQSNVLFTAAKNSKDHSSGTIVSLNNDGTVNNEATTTAIQKEIMSHGPVLTSFFVFNDFQTFWQNNIINNFSKRIKNNTFEDICPDVYIPNSQSGAAGAHSVAIVGWGYDEVTKKRFWEVRNSWGRVSLGDKYGPGIMRFAFSLDTPKNSWTGIDIAKPIGNGYYQSGPITFLAGEALNWDGKSEKLPDHDYSNSDIPIINDKKILLVVLIVIVLVLVLILLFK